MRRKKRLRAKSIAARTIAKEAADRRHHAAAKIESVIRMCQQKRAFQTRRKLFAVSNAATRLQSHTRRYLVRRQYVQRKKMVQATNAATRIQTNTRRYLVQRQYVQSRKLIKLANAATRLQARTRRYLAQRQYLQRKEHLEQHRREQEARVAATRIQAQIRVYVVRCRWPNRKSELQIQRQARGPLLHAMRAVASDLSLPLRRRQRKYGTSTCAEEPSLALVCRLDECAEKLSVLQRTLKAAEYNEILHSDPVVPAAAQLVSGSFDVLCSSSHLVKSLMYTAGFPGQRKDTSVSHAAKFFLPQRYHNCTYRSWTAVPTPRCRSQSDKRGPTQK